MYIKIKTDRLLLRPLCMDDLDTVHRYASDVELTRYMMNLPNLTLEESCKFISDAEIEWRKDHPEFFEFAVVMEGVQIGGVCLYLSDERTKGELGWIIDRNYHRKGYAAEMATAMVELARKIGLVSVYARCDSRNTASERVMQKLGMTLIDNSGSRFYQKKNETAGELYYEMLL